MNMLRSVLYSFSACCIFLLTPAVQAGPSYEVFGESLNADGWSSQPWGATVTTTTSPYFRGSKSAKVVYTTAMGVFKPVASSGFKTTGYRQLVFAVYNASNADDLWLVAKTTSGTLGTYLRVSDYTDRGAIVTGKWRWVRIPIEDLGLGSTPTLSFFSVASGKANASAYFDDVGFAASSVVYEGLASTTAGVHTHGPGIQLWSRSVGIAYYKSGANYYMKVTPSAVWGGVQFRHRYGDLYTSDYGALTIRWRQEGNLAEQNLHVSLVADGGSQLGVSVILDESYLPVGTDFEGGTWYHATIPMSAFSIDSRFLGGVTIESDAVKRFWIDDVRFVQKLKWMIPGVTPNIVGFHLGDHWLTSYCDPDTKQNRKLHSGNDYTDATDSGRSIYAATRGFVKQVREQTGWGYAVVLQHESGLTTSYLHLNLPAVSVGSEVQRGILLGTTKYLKDTSGKPISHLHFGVRLADYDSAVSQAGALPEMSCAINGTTYPAFSDRFIDSQGMDW